MIKYSDIIMKFESESGDACSHYTVSLKGNHTLQELVDYVLSNKEEWGNIELHQDGKEIARIEFSHGSLKKEVDAAYLNKEIELTRMDGGWTYMSYSCNLKGNIKTMRNVPTDIWLQVGEETPADADFKELGEVTWCSEKIEDNAIHYVNLDYIISLLKEKYEAISLADCILQDIREEVK